MNVVSRYQLGVNEAEARRVSVLEPELAGKILGVGQVGGLYIPRHKADVALDECFASWRRESRRGLVALVGDRGDGKRTTLRRFEERQQNEGIAIHNIELSNRLTTKEECVDWLAQALDLPAMKGDVERLTAAIQANLPPGIVVVHKAHWAYLRTVGGFEALRTLLYVLNTCGEKHFGCYRCGQRGRTCRA